MRSSAGDEVKVTHTHTWYWLSDTISQATVFFSSKILTKHLNLSFVLNKTCVTSVCNSNLTQVRLENVHGDIEKHHPEQTCLDKALCLSLDLCNQAISLRVAQSNIWSFLTTAKPEMQNQYYISQKLDGIKHLSKEYNTIIINNWLTRHTHLYYIISFVF